MIHLVLRSKNLYTAGWPLPSLLVLAPPSPTSATEHTFSRPHHNHLPIFKRILLCGGLTSASSVPWVFGGGRTDIHELHGFQDLGSRALSR